MAPPAHTGCCEAPRGAGVVCPERSHSSQEGRTPFLSLSPTRSLTLTCGPRGLGLNPDFGGGPHNLESSQIWDTVPHSIGKAVSFQDTVLQIPFLSFTG